MKISWKNYNEKSNKRYFFKVDLQYKFLPERMKIEKVKKLVANLHDKTEYRIHIRNLKQALNHGLVLKKFIEWLNLIEMLGLNHILI